MNMKREVGYDSNPTIFFSYIRFLLFMFRIICSCTINNIRYNVINYYR